MDFLLSVTISVILSVTISVKNSNTLRATDANRLTSSYWIPEARELKKALGVNEDAYLNFTELTTKYGYQSEEHTATTEDGYILTLFRILPKCENNDKLYPILLVHGLFDSSDVWIVPGTDLGLGYVLAENCFDVWAGNLRGNVYSRTHMTLDPNKDAKYWDYSFDEHGNFDLPALIDYVIRVTEKPKVFYAGHSQGTTDFFAMASLRPEYNQKVQLSIQIAPVAWMTNSYSPVPNVLAPNTKKVQALLENAGFNEFFAKHQLIHFISEILCQIVPDATCSFALTIATGLEPGSIKSDVLKIAFGHLLSGASAKSVAHYGQLIVSTRFKRFDEGIAGNVRRYKVRKPPDYNVSQITSSVLLICGKTDSLSSLKDVRTLASKLPNLVESYVVPLKKWSHHNHLWDERAKVYVIPKILQYLHKFNV